MLQHSALLGYPFRPFFILAGLYATAVVLAWIGFLFGDWPLPFGWSPLQWHSHEMIYGFAVAVIVGFAWVAAAFIGLTNMDPLQLVTILTLIIGGIVFYGSNKSTLDEKQEQIRAAEAKRAELIGTISLRVVH